MVACTMPAQSPASQHCSIDGPGSRESPPVAEELLIADGFGGRESQFSFRV